MGRRQGCIKLLDFSLSSIGWRRGLGRGGAFLLVSPLLGPLPARSSRGEDGELDAALGRRVRFGFGAVGPFPGNLRCAPFGGRARRRAGPGRPHGVRNIVEFDHCPDAALGARFAPTVIWSNNVSAYAHNDPLPLRFCDTFRLTVSYTGSDNGKTKRLNSVDDQ